MACVDPSIELRGNCRRHCCLKKACCKKKADPMACISINSLGAKWLRKDTSNKCFIFKDIIPLRGLGEMPPDGNFGGNRYKNCVRSSLFQKRQLDPQKSKDHLVDE